MCTLLLYYIFDIVINKFVVNFVFELNEFKINANTRC